MALTGLVAANNLGDVVDIERTWDNIGSNISATVFVPAATLDLNFAGNKSLVDNISGSGLVTFTRASSGTFVGSNGLIQNAASGVPRFDHDPATGESLGLLVEEARTNSFIYSNTFADASWGQIFGTTLTCTASAAVSPDGTSNATQITATDANFFRQQGVGDTTTIRTLSFFAKAGTASTISVRFFSNSAPTSPTATFNLSTGAATVSDASVLTASIVPFPNGWYRCIGCRTDAVSKSPPDFNFGVGTTFIYGAQLEAGSFPTSYIPTTTATVTRAADVASMTGTNFSSWYRQDEGTLAFSGKAAQSTFGLDTMLWSIVDAISSSQTGYASIAIPTNSIKIYSSDATAQPDRPTLGAFVTSNTFKTAMTYNSSLISGSLNGATAVGRNKVSAIPTLTALTLGRFADLPAGYCYHGTIAHLSYYPVRLSNITLQALTTLGPVSSFLYSFSIKGRDILALKEANKTSTRDFVFIKGLASKVQPRINTASQYTASGVALRNAAMLKVAPTTAGNYFFSSGLTLSGTTVQINGTNARSIATSPFSGSTALCPLLFAGLRPQANWRITEPMTSGTVTSPESAIPIETSDFLLFIKAGQS
jgi:hypothetical protein